MQQSIPVNELRVNDIYTIFRLQNGNVLRDAIFLGMDQVENKPQFTAGAGGATSLVNPTVFGFRHPPPPPAAPSVEKQNAVPLIRTRRTGGRKRRVTRKSRKGKSKRRFTSARR